MCLLGYLGGSAQVLPVHSGCSINASRAHRKSMGVTASWSSIKYQLEALTPDWLPGFKSQLHHFAASGKILTLPVSSSVKIWGRINRSLMRLLWSLNTIIHRKCLDNGWNSTNTQSMSANLLCWALRGREDERLSPWHLKEVIIQERRKPRQQKHHKVVCDTCHRKRATMSLGYGKADW